MIVLDIVWISNFYKENIFIEFLKFMLFGKFFVLLDKSVDTIDHFLNKLDFWVSKSVLVGDIVSNT